MINMAESVDTGEQTFDERKKEIKEIRGKIQSLKKSLSRGDKRKKKEVLAEIAKLESDLEKLIEQKNEDTVVLPTDMGVAIDNVQSIEEVNTKKSRAQKQKEKKLMKEQERERRIAEGEIKEIDTERYIERSKLLSLLEPLGLTIKDIIPDGNCLYAAISDQLNIVHNKNLDIQELRIQCSNYIKSNPDNFISFITSPDSSDICTPEQLIDYCANIEHTNDWGGEIEIVALSHVHNVPVTIHQAEAPPILIGNDEYSSNKMIHLSYHRHEFSLGKHYNSVINL